MRLRARGAGRDAVAAMVALMLAACTQPAQPRKAIPAPVATPNPVAAPSPVAPLTTVLPRDAPGLPAAIQDLRLGVTSADARKRWPTLFEPQGQKVAEGPARLSARFDRELDVLVGVGVTFPSPEALETAVMDWGEPVRVLWRDSLCVRTWFNANASLRALAFERAQSAGEKCPPRHDSRAGETSSLYLEQAWPIEQLLGGVGASWGFEQGRPLLHATATELRARFGRRAYMSEMGELWLRLPALGTAEDPVSVGFTFVGGRAERYWINADLGGLGLGRDALLARVGAKWGEQTTVGDQFRFGGDPVLTVRMPPDLDAYLEVRDLTRCSEQRFNDAQARHFTLVDRWLAAHTTEAQPAGERREYAKIADYTIRERTETAGGCELRYHQLSNNLSSCGEELIADNVFARDCCTAFGCPASAEAWMLRWSDALARKDLAALRRMIPAAGLHASEHWCIGEDPCEDADARLTHDASDERLLSVLASWSSWEGARCYERDKLPAELPEHFMNQPPDPWPKELFAVCEAGSAASLVRYFWIGDAASAALERIESTGH
jgi:hypothetical protein